MKQWTLSSLILILNLSFCFSQESNFRLVSGIDPVEDRWVDSVFNSMDATERLGQLFMIRAHSDKGPDHVAQVEAQIKKYKVGGLCFFQGTPDKQLNLTNRYQELSENLPLMVAIDGEWGLGMRMKATTISFPRQLMLGAIQDNELIYEMGREVASQLKRTGININFAPAVDVNNNAANPVINTRSFGEDRFNVTIKSYMYMKGMQDAGVMACAKHFPGHGDTDVDSHYDLPIIKHDRQRLDSIELYPFRVLAKEGVGSMMVAHLSVPTFDDRPNRPTSLSRNTVTNVLRNELDFQGLTFTDGLEMKGVTKYFGDGEVEAESIMAGNDILLLPEDIDASFKAIRRYIAEGKIEQAQVDESVRRVLRSKYRLGLQQYTPLKEQNIRTDLNNANALALKEKLIQASLTMVRNNKSLIPFAGLENTKMASLSMGSNSETAFQNRLGDYKKMDHYQLPKKSTKTQRDQAMQQLSEKEVVVVGLHDMSQFARYNFGLEKEELDFLYQLNRSTKVVLVVFGNPYSLKYFDRFPWVMCAYDEDPMTQDLAAQGLFGVFSIRGRLPVTASSRATFNTGNITPKSYRMGYSIPEGQGLNSDTLLKIDQIIQEAIDERATPGAVVLVAKNGHIVFEKAYGHHTYDKRRKVKVDDIYDLASITKIAATTLSVMRLQGEGKMSTSEPINNYLPELNASNKNGKLVKDIMAHHAGLIGWIPFYQQTMSGSRRNPKPMPKFYKNIAAGIYNIKVTDNLYLRKDFQDSIWQQIIHSDLRSNTNYRYSDLGFYMLSEAVKRQTGQSIDQYAYETFYKPMGLEHTSYVPLEKFDKKQIVPTERDNYFRKTTIQGTVHDMGAAMLDGVSGHAGLFSNAKDLATLMQMLIQNGFYGGKRYLQAETIQQFTQRHPRSTRRGIGFDMLELDQNRDPNLSRDASVHTYGHLGFTGTAVWVDPVYDLVYVFLSNRTYPSMNNNKLYKLDIRP
ncbi:MAG: glycoside hydrolase family 3 N-terminal domain-containing protein, partial [Bacteroidota bacterium]